MKNILQPLYELFYDIENGTPYLNLLNAVYGENTNGEYDKIGWILLILVPILLLLTFYKLWEPMRKQRLMWVFTISVISLIAYLITYHVFLFKNQDILIAIRNYNGDPGQVDPIPFVRHISLITTLFAFLLSILYSMIIKRFSINNSHNPF